MPEGLYKVVGRGKRRRKLKVGIASYSADQKKKMARVKKSKAYTSAKTVEERKAVMQKADLVGKRGRAKMTGQKSVLGTLSRLQKTTQGRVTPPGSTTKQRVGKTIAKIKRQGAAPKAGRRVGALRKRKGKK